MWYRLPAFGNVVQTANLFGQKEVIQKDDRGNIHNILLSKVVRRGKKVKSCVEKLCRR